MTQAAEEQKALTVVNLDLPVPSLDSLSGLLNKYRSQIERALPKHLDADRMTRILLTVWGGSPTLKKCTGKSILACAVQTSILGLEPDGTLGEAYLVPFWNDDLKQYECQLIPGYQGLLKLVRNTGELKQVNAQPVHKNDIFEFEDGLDPYLKHKRAPGERGPVIAYWAGALLHGGGKHIVVMTREDADSHRKKYSKAKKGPWFTEFDAMALKTCLRKLAKLLPKSTQAKIAVSLDERAEVGVPQKFSAEVPLELHSPEPELRALPEIREAQRKSAKATQVFGLDEMRQVMGDAEFFRVLGIIGYEKLEEVPPLMVAQVIAELKEAFEGKKPSGRGKKDRP